MEQEIADATDRKILRVLSGDARISNAELADRIGLSPSPYLRRVRRLEEAGIIEGCSARIDPAVEGWTMAALVTVKLSRQNEDEILMFEKAVRSWEEVAECHLIAGTPDYILKVRGRRLERMNASSS